jgi:hypothetical protein
MGSVYESPAELEELQALLDESHRHGGDHLRSILGDKPRLTAAEVVDLLPGMQVIDLATVTGTGEPRVAPVDGHFFRAHWYFGSARNSARARHLAARPAASIALTRGEEFGLVAHGEAVEVDLRAAEQESFLAHLRDFYPTFDDWGSLDGPYWRLDARRMFIYSPERR